MKLYYTRIILLFLPFVYIFFGFAGGYTLLYWLLFIQWPIVPLKEDLVHLWIPIAVSFVLVLLVLRPRVHLLKLDKNNGKIRTLYYFVAAVGIFLPTLFLVELTDTATGTLIQLNSINKISTVPASRYYVSKSLFVNVADPGFQSTMSYSGKNNQDLNFDIYAALPMTNDSTDTLEAKAFYFLRYHERHGRLSDSERESEWTRFWKESMDRYEKETLQFQYFERMGNTEERDQAILAAGKTSYYKTGTPVILKPVDAPFSARNGQKLNYAFLSLGIASIFWMIMILIPGVHEDKLKSFNQTGSGSIKKQLAVYYKYLLPEDGMQATWALAVVNILVFTIMVFKGLGFNSFYTADLVNWGAIYKPYLLEKGQWWRLVSGMFLHGGIMHLFMNMVSLYLCGMFLEKLVGTRKYIFAYFIAGIAAGLFSAWWHTKPVVAVGASGAIFGLYGVLLALIMRKVLDRALNKVLLTLLACTAGYSLLIGALSQGVDNSAHIGGLVCGFVVGLVYAGRMVKVEVEDREREMVEV
jgi:rhomboid protease GluP